MKTEIILYQSEELPEHIEVRLDEENETFWLSLNQIAELFERDKSVISRHLKNIFNNGELDRGSVVAFFATTASDGKTYNVEHFDLDAVLSVGYRINRLENKMEKIDLKVNEISFQLKSSELPTQGIFFEGQIFDAYELASRIIRSAKRSIILIDNYIDENTLTHLSKKNKAVKVLLLTKTTSKSLELDLKKVNEQYGNFELKAFTKSHDRFLIIDNIEVYHLGASLKDLGKKWFAFSKMDKNSVESILKGVSG